MKDTSAIYSFRGVRQPVWVFGVILVCLALFSSLEAYQLSGYESMSVLAPLEKEMATMMYAEDESELNADIFAEDASMIDLAQSVGISKYSQHCTSDKLNSLRKPWDNALSLAKDRLVIAAEEKLSFASKELDKLNAATVKDAKKIAAAQKKVTDATAAVKVARDDAQKTTAAFKTKYAGAAPSKPIAVTDDDLMCYYSSPRFNLKVFDKVKDTKCGNGYELSTTPASTGKLTETQLGNLKKKIFSLVSKHNTGKFDVATLHKIEVVPRTSSNQRVVLFLHDRVNGCAYPVAHVVIPETAKEPHTEKILADLNMFSKDMMVDIAAKHYQIDTTKQMNRFSTILYSYYAPCESCSKVVMNTWAAQRDKFAGHSIVYNCAMCNGKSYEAQHQRVTAANKSSADLFTSQQILRETPEKKDGQPKSSANRNPVSSIQEAEKKALLAKSKYQNAVAARNARKGTSPSNEVTRDMVAAIRLGQDAIEEAASACYFAQSTVDSAKLAAEAARNKLATVNAKITSKTRKTSKIMKEKEAAAQQVARITGDLTTLDSCGFTAAVKQKAIKVLDYAKQAGVTAASITKSFAAANKNGADSLKSKKPSQPPSTVPTVSPNLAPTAPKKPFLPVSTQRGQKRPAPSSLASSQPSPAKRARRDSNAATQSKTSTGSSARSSSPSSRSKSPSSARSSSPSSRSSSPSPSSSSSRSRSSSPSSSSASSRSRSRSPPASPRGVKRSASAAGLKSKTSPNLQANQGGSRTGQQAKKVRLVKK